jgi:hypothetical protein
MDQDRLWLHNQLSAAFPDLKLIFRSPSNKVLEYPCIVYDVDDLDVNHANNEAFVVGTTFQLQVMSVYPGYSGIHDILRLFPKASFIRSYMYDDIVHDIFRVQVKTV